MRRPKELLMCVATLILSVMTADFASAGNTNRAAGSDAQTSQEAPVRKTGRPKLRMRSFGQLPDWAKQSWFIRR